MAPPFHWAERCQYWHRARGFESVTCSPLRRPMELLDETWVMSSDSDTGDRFFRLRLNAVFSYPGATADYADRNRLSSTFASPMKWAVTLGFVLSGLLLLIWPFFILFGLTLPMDPSHPRGIANLVSLIGAVLYPVIWGISLFYAMRGLTRKYRAEVVGFAVAAPYMYIALWGLISS